MSKKYKSSLKQDTLADKQVLEVIVDELNFSKDNDYPIEILNDYEGDDLVESYPNIVLEEKESQVKLRFLTNIDFPFPQALPRVRLNRSLFSTEEKTTIDYLCNLHNLISINCFTFYYHKVFEANFTNLIQNIDDSFIVVNKETLSDIKELSLTKDLIDDMVSYVNDIKIFIKDDFYRDVYVQNKESIDYMIESVYKLKNL